MSKTNDKKQNAEDRALAQLLRQMGDAIAALNEDVKRIKKAPDTKNDKKRKGS